MKRQERYTSFCFAVVVVDIEFVNSLSLPCAKR